MKKVLIRHAFCLCFFGCKISVFFSPSQKQMIQTMRGLKISSIKTRSVTNIHPTARMILSCSHAYFAAIIIAIKIRIRTKRIIIIIMRIIIIMIIKVIKMILIIIIMIIIIIILK